MASERLESLRLQLQLVTEALAGLGDEAPDPKLNKKTRDGLKKLATVDLQNVIDAIDPATQV